MSKRNLLSRSLLVAFGGATLGGNLAFGQDAPVQELQRVTVTGSSIKRTDTETAGRKAGGIDHLAATFTLSSRAVPKFVVARQQKQAGQLQEVVSFLRAWQLSNPHEI